MDFWWKFLDIFIFCGKILASSIFPERGAKMLTFLKWMLIILSIPMALLIGFIMLPIKPFWVALVIAIYLLSRVKTLFARIVVALLVIGILGKIFNFWRFSQSRNFPAFSFSKFSNDFSQNFSQNFGWFFSIFYTIKEIKIFYDELSR